jgi:hypothetical protein
MLLPEVGLGAVVGAITVGESLQVREGRSYEGTGQVVY